MQKPADVFKSPGDDEEFVLSYLDTLRENMVQSEQSISRQLLLITILSAAFLLLAENQVGSITISFVKLTKYAYIESFLPLVIAAVYLSTINTMQMARKLTSTHDQLIQYLKPEIVEYRYERLLYPPAGAFTAAAALPLIMDGKVNRRVTRVVGQTRFLLYIVGPILMVSYAIYYLLSSSPGPLQYAAASLSIVIILIASPLSVSLIFETIKPSFHLFLHNQAR